MTPPSELPPGGLPENNRRTFLKTMLVAGTAPLVLPSRVSADAAPKHKIKIGLIGCGGRGTWIAKLFVEHGGYEIVAAADYFQDRLDAFSAELGVSADQCYSGLSGYQKLIDDGGVDAVVIKSPPYFHPAQAEYAVKAGKHVYLAKPVAVDVPGSLSIEASGAMATDAGLTYLVDFQTRANDIFVEAMRRVHDGALGKLSFGESSYHANDPFANAAEVLGPDPSDPERRLRVWGVDRALSGDIITEQNIHTLDVMSWIMNKPPIKAMGSSNQTVRPWGNCQDHFSVVYDYGDGVDVSFTSRQFAAHGTKPDGIRNRMFGEDGVLETEYSGRVLLRGGTENFYKGGHTRGLYGSGAVNNIATFHQAVMNGDASNTTVAPSVRSNLVTVLGREAAYTGETVTWEQLLRSNQALKHDLELKA